MNVSFRLAFVCVTFPQLERAVATERFAAVLPTLVRPELPASRFTEYRDPVFGKHAAKMSLAWATRLERQRPRVAALIPKMVAGLGSSS